MDVERHWRVRELAMVLVAVAVVFLLGVLIARVGQGLRWGLVLMVMFLVGVLALTRPKAAMLAVLAYLPFMGLIRRYVYAEQGGTPFDPLLMVAPVATVCLAVYTVVNRFPELQAALTATRLSKAMTVLMVVFVVQMANPLQGSPLVGITAAIYYLVPLAWFYLARLYLSTREARLVLLLVVGCAVLTGLWGLKQTFFGFTEFEAYWIKYGGYVALQVQRIIRSFSTFVSASEYALYLSMAIAASGGLFLSRFNPVYLAPLVVLVPALVLIGSRGPLVFTLLALVVLGAVRTGHGARAILVVIVVALGLMFGLEKLTPGAVEEELSPQQQSRIADVLEHQLGGLTDPFNRQTSTLPKLLDLMRETVTDHLAKNPFGYGLGVTTLAGSKFGPGAGGAEFGLLDIFLNSGVLGGAIYVFIIYELFRRLGSMAMRSHAAMHLAVLGALVATFGYWLFGSTYVIGPTIFALIGWIDREEVAFRQREQARLRQALAALGTAGHAAALAPPGARHLGPQQGRLARPAARLARPLPPGGVAPRAAPSAELPGRGGSAFLPARVSEARPGEQPPWPPAWVAEPELPPGRRPDPPAADEGGEHRRP